MTLRARRKAATSLKRKDRAERKELFVDEAAIQAARSAALATGCQPGQLTEIHQIAVPRGSNGACRLRAQVEDRIGAGRLLSSPTTLATPPNPATPAGPTI
jgi:hypothetical protein